MAGRLEVWLLLAARTLAGAFGGLLGGQAMAIVADVFPENRRGQATGALMSAFAIASVAGVPLGIVIGNHFGWQVPFLLLAGLSLPLLGLAAWAMPPIRAGPPSPSMRATASARSIQASSAPAIWAANSGLRPRWTFQSVPVGFSTPMKTRARRKT